MSKPSSELREAIAQRLTEASAVGGIIYPNSTLVDAILDAVIASLPEQNHSEGFVPLLNQRLLGYNDCLSELRELLQSAKSISKESE